MNTMELKHFLEKYNTLDTIIIVCDIDELPTRKKLLNNKNYGFVINLSKRDTLGSHWVSLFITKIHKSRNSRNNLRNGYYMDSYGFRPRSWYLTEFLKNNCNHVEYSGRQLQQLQSDVCGMYAACCIIHMVRGYPFKEFTYKFSNNLLINDLFIRTIYHYYRRNSFIYI